MNLLDPMAVVKRRIVLAIGVAAAIALLVALGWGALEHRWRVVAEDRLNSIRIVLDQAMGNAKPTKPKDLPDGVKKMATEMNNQAARANRAESVVELQTASIDRLEQETVRAEREVAAKQKMIEATLRERDRWSRRAREAETRTEKMTAEKELQQCEEVLNSLYYAGF